MNANEIRINALFEELVPSSGKADTVAGEIIRAICRIGYRNYNDGDHVGVGYGKETCNASARYLAKKGSDDMAHRVGDLWGMWDDDTYDLLLEKLEAATLAYIDQHPELKSTPNEEDMFDYYDPYEDVDNDDEDEEDW